MSQGLEHDQLAHKIVEVYRDDISRLAVLFSERGITLDTLLGTIIELVDDTLVTGETLSGIADPTLVEGGLAHFTLGYVCGLTDRDSRVGMEGV